LSEKENPLLERKELKFVVKYAGATPSFKEVRETLIEKIKSDEKLTVVDNVKTDYGKTTALGYAKVYANEKSIKIEPKYRLQKNLEGKKKRTKGAPEAAAAKPAEKAEKPAGKEKEKKG